MTKLPRKLLSLLLSLMLTAGAVLSAPLTANAADAQGKVYPTIMNSFYGDCGTDTTYYCFPDGSMAIFGTGAIADYSLLNGNTTAVAGMVGLNRTGEDIHVRALADGNAATVFLVQNKKSRRLTNAYTCNSFFLACLTGALSFSVLLYDRLFFYFFVLFCNFCSGCCFFYYSFCHNTPLTKFPLQFYHEVLRFLLCF